MMKDVTLDHCMQALGWFGDLHSVPCGEIYGVTEGDIGRVCVVKVPGMALVLGDTLSDCMSDLFENWIFCVDNFNAGNDPARWGYGDLVAVVVGGGVNYVDEGENL